MSIPKLNMKSQYALVYMSLISCMMMAFRFVENWFPHKDVKSNVKSNVLNNIFLIIYFTIQAKYNFNNFSSKSNHFEKG